VSQERSVRFSGKLRSICVGLGAVAALTAAGAVFVATGERPNEGPRAAPSPSASSAVSASMATTATPNRRTTQAQATRRHQRKAQAVRPLQTSASAASSDDAPRPVNEERARLLETAHRELQLLEVQEPQNFLVLFDMMREDAPGQDKALEAGRSASHAYILARMRILERMLRRFIDDPDSDCSLESEALAQVDADFKGTIDALSRDVPSMASVQEILTTTMLKAPAFTEPRPAAE